MRPVTLHPRRGIAMLLVMIAVSMATILATAYLASRDSTLLIARNNSALTEARYAAMSGADMAAALLQTEVNWRTGHVGGVLVADQHLGAALVTISARDLQTGGPPTTASEYLQVTAAATVDVNGDGTAEGQGRSSFAAFVPRTSAKRVVADQGDFAVFTHATIELYGNATVARWPTAPLSALGRRVNIATRRNGTATVVVQDSGACIDCTLHYTSGSSSSILSNPYGPPIVLRPIPFDMQQPAPPPTNEAATADLKTDYVRTSGTYVFNTNQRYRQVNLSGGAELRLDGNVTLYCEDDLVLNNARLLINGNAKVCAWDNMVLSSGASIQLMPGATMQLFVGNDVQMTDSYIGNQMVDAIRDHTGYEDYMDPARLRIWSLQANKGTGGRLWQIMGNSVIKASIYSVQIELVMQGTSALYGRFAGESIKLYQDCSVFYDHSLDRRAGYTQPDSVLFNSDGSQNTNYLGIVSLSPSTLQTVANNTMTHIVAVGITVSPTTPPEPGGATVVPTPRPVRITRDDPTVGADMMTWEAEASVAGAPG